MIYKSPRTVFQQKINNIIDKDIGKENELFEDIFKINQLFTLEKKVAGIQKDDPDQWLVLMELYHTFGSMDFAKMISICKGKTITFPTEEEFQDSITTVLCYYYKEVENLQWEEIKTKLSMPKLNTIKFGIRVRQLREFIDQQMLKKLKKRGK